MPRFSFIMAPRSLSWLLLAPWIARVAASCAHGTHLFPRAAEGQFKPPTFGYSGEKGPANWISLNPEANVACSLGRHQSPINMLPGVFTTVPGSDARLNMANFDAGAKFLNLGTTVEIDATPINGTLQHGGKTYRLKQWHYHTPSEHLDNGTAVAMEQHMVFETDAKEIAVMAMYIDIASSAAPSTENSLVPRCHGAGPEDPSGHDDDDGSEDPTDPSSGDGPALPEALKPCQNPQTLPEALRCIASLMQMMNNPPDNSPEPNPATPPTDDTPGTPTPAPSTPAPSTPPPGTVSCTPATTPTTPTTPSPLLETIFNYVNSIATPGACVQTAPLDMREIVDLLQQGSFQKYSGSLATPPCSEGVTWLVSTQKLYITPETFLKARNVLHFNSRFTQARPGTMNVLELQARTVRNIVPMDGNPSPNGNPSPVPNPSQNGNPSPMPNPSQNGNIPTPSATGDNHKSQKRSRTWG